jgi:hypothetical protein
MAIIKQAKNITTIISKDCIVIAKKITQTASVKICEACNGDISLNAAGKINMKNNAH